MGKNKKRFLMKIWGLMFLGLLVTIIYSVGTGVHAAEMTAEETKCEAPSTEKTKEVSQSGANVQESDTQSSGSVGGNPTPTPTP